MLSLQRLVGFSERYRLRIKRDDCGDSIVPGKFGHLYEHDVHRLGMVLEALSDNARWHKTLRARRRRAIATGFVLHQEAIVRRYCSLTPATPSRPSWRFG